MKTYNDQASKFFNREVSPEIENFIDCNLQISKQVIEYLDELDISQKDFAKMLGKSEPEISKWLSGMHNLTLKSIAKMQTALGKEIIITPKKAKSKYKEIKYVTFKVSATKNSYSGKTNFSDFRRSGELFKKAI